MLNWPAREGEPRAQLPESTEKAKRRSLKYIISAIIREDERNIRGKAGKAEKHVRKHIC
jgi:hypothetical protein